MYHLAISLLSYLSTLEGELPLGPQSAEEIVGCRTDSDCTFDKACINSRCVDPCSVQDPCGRNADCRPIVHRPYCTCKSGFEGNPDDYCKETQARSALHGRFYGGDMIFEAGIPPDVSHAGIKNEQLRWPGYPGSGVIPYVIDSSVRKHKGVIEKAMDQYHKLTCIKFVPRKAEKNYINIMDDGNGCASHVGMVNIGAQPVYLGDGCHYVGTIVHELGHAIGLFHEHQRSDRDRHINIYRNNVTDGVLENLAITNSADEIIITPYDYNSIMHYGNYAFSKDPDNLMTMEAKNGQKLLEPDEKPGLTNRDVDIVRKLYKC